MYVEDILVQNPKAFTALEDTLSQQFGLVAHCWTLKKDCMDDAVWGTGNRDDNAVVLGVDLDSTDSRANNLPNEVTGDAGGKIPVLYTTSGGPSSPYDF